MESQTVTKKINFIDLVNQLFGVLSSRERDVLQRRHGLNKGTAKKETLEKIGQEYQVTRERVRQIERDGVKKLKEKLAASGITESLEEISGTIKKLMKKYGGVMSEEHLLQSLVDFYRLSSEEMSPDDLLQHKKSLAFIISELLAEKFEKVEDQEKYHATWKLKDTPWSLIEEVIEKLVVLIEGHGQPLKADELFAQVKQRPYYADLQTKVASLKELEEDLVDLDEAILSYLRASKQVEQNLFGHIGLANWNTIKPKRMNDKIYLVLKEAARPLHFTEIAGLINTANFDHKKALPATIHNELILDDRYVLIGRGIYALKEWGYEPGTVSEVLSGILKRRGPLTKDQITEEVAKQRLVKKATINLALMDKNKFKKLSDKRYSLVNEN